MIRTLLLLLVAPVAFAQTYPEIVQDGTPYPEADVREFLLFNNCLTNPGQMGIQFEGGTSAQRDATFEADPLDPSNTALHFEVADGWIDENPETGAARARVQLNAYNIPAANHIVYKHRMLIPESMAEMKNIDGLSNFLTISEWWNDAGWEASDYPFRISVNLTKKDAAIGTPLTLEITAQKKDESNEFTGSIWRVTSEYELPIGEWFDVRYEMVDGDDTTGRWRMHITDSEGIHTIADVTNYTHHPDNPSSDGMTDLNPIKLYTSTDPLIDHMVANSTQVDLWFDDLRIWIAN